ncbi:MAG: GspE/PulE family protein [Phycisphaerales bacterium]
MLTSTTQHDSEHANGEVMREFFGRIPIEYAREHLVLCEGCTDDRLQLVCAGCEDDDIVAHNIAVRLGRPVERVPGDAEEIANRLDTLIQSSDRGDASDEAGFDGIDELDESDLRKLIEADERDLLGSSGQAPVVKLVNSVLLEALRQRASDVHIQPREDRLLVRQRIDGVLFDARSLPVKLLQPVVSRIKVMGGLDIAERRLPQDGRTRVTLGSAEIDLRISTLPTARGERVVIRLLDKRDTSFFDLARLGMPDDVSDRFLRACERSHGMVLVTGPTGSGKTTTLYSVLGRLNSSELNVMTLEDPIEYELPGISQSQINTRKGVTFATGLRHILRQDPDVIMVGEIRDTETARIAIQSALTGHMVFSTLHTNSAASAVVRLSDLGIEPYLINASLSAVLAQRLARRICPACGGQSRDEPPCVECRGSGYRGRVGLYELLITSPAIRELVANDASTAELHERARSEGMRTLREAGLDLVSGGFTTVEEVDRVTLIDDSIIAEDGAV